MVRPWKPSSAATITGRDGPWWRRTSLSAASLASVPELVKNTRPSAAEQGEQALGQGDLALVQEQVGGVRDGLHLAGHRPGDRRVSVAERADRDAGDEVGVLLAVGVPDPAALAAHQRHRRHPVVAHERRLEPGLQLLRRHVTVRFASRAPSRELVPGS